MFPAPTQTARLQARQLWGAPYRSSSQPCLPTTLASGGVLYLGPSSTITLSEPVIFQSNETCYVGDPFYASSWVFIYVLATCTTIAWILFTLLLITQRTFHPARAPSSTRWPGHGFATLIPGRPPLGGFGARPWLQKTAALLVSTGLTVASVDALRQARFQNAKGITNAVAMRDDVSGALAVRIMRVISGVFVWLAQVQTLIRLFPRRKEKLVIKWFSFTLILCDLVFSSLNSFLISSQYSRVSPRDYQDALPALSYLFQLAISLLYMAWVLYYVATKRRYAFFRPDQVNMSIVALLALISIAIPVAFFVADISIPPVAGWGDFFRWAAGAAASIVVWEWVDRIEATEREEKKDGILGTEVFDEDEWPLSQTRRGSAFSASAGSSGSTDEEAAPRKGFTSRYLLGVVKKRFRARSDDRGPGLDVTNDSRRHARSTWRVPRNRKMKEDAGATGGAQNLGAPVRQLSPPSRTNTTSVGSTVYAVDYHPIMFTPPAPQHPSRDAYPSGDEAGLPRPVDGEVCPSVDADLGRDPQHTDHKRLPTKVLGADSIPGFKFIHGAFRKHKSSPPVEVKRVMSLDADGSQAIDGYNQNKDGVQRRMRALRPRFADRSILRKQEGNASLEPTVIPAPPRGQTWSPDVARHSPVDPRQQVRGVRDTLLIHPALPRMEEGEEAAQQNTHDDRENLEAGGRDHLNSGVPVLLEHGDLDEPSPTSAETSVEPPREEAPITESAEYSRPAETHIVSGDLGRASRELRLAADGRESDG